MLHASGFGGGSVRFPMWLAVAGVLSVAPAVIPAQLPPPPITRQDCTLLKGKEQQKCEAKQKAADAADAAATAKARSALEGDMPTGADADVPGEPPSPRPATKTADAGQPAAGRSGSKGKPDTSDMPTGKDADPPAESMQPLKPDGTPDTQAPVPAGASSSSSSSSSSAADEDDAPPTTAGGDSPVKPSALKDLGSHADTSASRAKLKEHRIGDDVNVGRYYMQTGNMVGAEKRFRDALQHDPDDPDAHFALAELMLKQKRTPEAQAELRRYLELAPDDDHTKQAQKMLARISK